MEVLRTENITYTYSKGTPYEKCAVNDVSISLEKGEIICINFLWKAIKLIILLRLLPIVTLVIYVSEFLGLKAVAI